jgi:hypothetical protein
MLQGQDQGRQAMTASMAGGGGMTVSMVIKQRERAQGQKIAKCGKRERGA